MVHLQTEFTNDAILVRQLTELSKRRYRGSIEARYSLCGTSAVCRNRSKLCQLLKVPVFADYARSPCQLALLTARDAAQARKAVMTTRQRNWPKRRREDQCPYSGSVYLRRFCLAKEKGIRTRSLACRRPSQVLYEAPALQGRIPYAFRKEKADLLRLRRGAGHDELGELSADNGETEFRISRRWYEWERRSPRDRSGNVRHHLPCAR